MNSKKIVLLLSCMLIIIVGLTGCKEYSCEKLSSLEDIPQVVREKLSDVKLTRGVYFFSSAFTNENSYVVVCGEKGQAGYDADIEVVDYIPLAEDNYTLPPVPIFGLCKIKINEEPSQTRPEYSSNSEHPYTVFQLSERVGKQNWLTLAHSDKLVINNWWGRGSSRLETEDVVCEVIESREDVPEYVLQLFERRIISKKAIWSIQPSNGSRDIRWLVVPGDENTPFGISIEAIEWKQSTAGPVKGSGNMHFFDLVLRRIITEETCFWKDSIPFSVIKVQSNEYETIQDGNIVVFDDNLKWSLSKCGVDIIK